MERKNNIVIGTDLTKTHNSCLYKKIAISVNGDIKNCPSIGDVYGNVKNMSIHSILLKKEFKHLWNINKDQIDICKSCEFRYMCSDCRAYIQDETNLYSKPSKCSYNPYEMSW